MFCRVRTTDLSVAQVAKCSSFLVVVRAWCFKCPFRQSLSERKQEALLFSTSHTTFSSEISSKLLVAALKSSLFAEGGRPPEPENGMRVIKIKSTSSQQRSFAQNGIKKGLFAQPSREKEGSSRREQRPHKTSGKREKRVDFFHN